MKKIVEHHTFPTIMYGAITIVCILILFSVTSIMTEAANNQQTLKQPTKTNIDSTLKEKPIETSKEINEPTIPDETQLYSTGSYVLFYAIIMAILALLIIVGGSLKSTILKNIEAEEHNRKIEIGRGYY